MCDGLDAFVDVAPSQCKPDTLLVRVGHDGQGDVFVIEGHDHHARLERLGSGTSIGLPARSRTRQHSRSQHRRRHCAEPRFIQPFSPCRQPRPHDTQLRRAEELRERIAAIRENARRRPKESG